MKKIIKLMAILTSVFMLCCCASTNSKAAAAKTVDTAKKTTEQADVLQDPGVVLLYNKDLAVVDTGSKPFNSTSATQTVKDMTIGWNLGNSFDATSGSSNYSETSWGQPLTTREMIDGLAASGIKTIRIPVSWSNHMDKTNYTIKPEWMTRVKEVVDWAIDDGMYVILNCHHDCFEKPAKMPQGFGYYPNTKNKVESERFLLNLWTQIGTAFNNGYDEHLIFETMNEPRLRGTNHEWWYDANASECNDAAECLNEYNQVAVDAIRATGGNNEKRFISCPGLQASPDSAMSAAFKMPTDDAPDKLIVSVHMYSPYNFAMASPGERKFTDGHKKELSSTFSRLNKIFISNGYPVYIGEMGAVNKDNLEERVKWFEYFLTESRKYGITSILWDNGAWDLQGKTDYNEKFGYYNRREQTWYFPELLDAMIESTKD